MNGINLERVKTTKLLGTTIHEHIKWDENMKNVAASCYATLAVLKKIKNMLPFHVKKAVVQSLVLSKLYYNDIIYHNLPEYLLKRLQKIQNAAASLVLGRYCKVQDIQKLRWLFVKEQLQWHYLKAIHKSLYHTHWPEDLQLKIFRHERTLRSSSGLLLEIPMVSHTFQDQACIYFNSLPEHIRNCTNFKRFSKDTFNYLFKQVYNVDST